MAFPMNMKVERIVESGCQTQGDLFERLEFWAARYGFHRSADQGAGFIYHRGSHWQAVYTFDIRKVPTEVVVRFIPETQGVCFCSFTCGSWLQASTPDDEARLSAEMDLLEACLKGAISNRPIAAEFREAVTRFKMASSQIQKGNESA
jgi:hypothetical protein